MPTNDSNSGELSRRILRYLRDSEEEPQKPRKLARSMGVTEDEYPAFRVAIKELRHAGRIVRGGGNTVTLPDTANEIVGRFRGNPRGFGFVVPDDPTDHGDLYIGKNATRDAITGDTVIARITRRGKHGDPSLVEGEIIEIIERGHSQFVGELVRHGGDYLMIPDGNVLHEPIHLGDVSASRAKPGAQIVVELSQFPGPGQPARGVIVEVLGRRGDPEIDTISIIRQYHLPEAFPDEVKSDAQRVIRDYDLDQELPQRVDWRGEVTVTIDPDDAKDFDDAISIRQLDNGRIELGVHIADVSAFVKPGTPLDREAEQRGNSVYLPQRVIPMLPEVLSNGLCSLQPEQPRLAKSVFIEYDDKGRRRKKRYACTVIQSDQRLTYNEATKILDGKTRGFPKKVVALVQEMDRLARVIQTRRRTDGMIVLDLQDTELVLDENGALIDVVPEDTSFSHTIIEMFMVEANEAVAELFAELDVPHIRRIHPEPPEDAQGKLTQFITVLGHKVPKTIARHDLIRLLESVRGTPAEFPVNLAVLRSMSQAEYSPKMIGHYALASRHYSHFTSPIRRYPDLVIHRLLQRYLEKRLETPQQRSSAPGLDTLTEIGKHCSYTERHAEAAERECKLVKVLRFLEGHVGEIEPGVVTGIANIGVFVQLTKYRIDGLIRFDDLPDDWWDIDQRAGCAVGQHSGQRVQIGDPVKVQIAGVDLPARELDLVLAPGTKLSRKKPDRPSGGDDRQKHKPKGRGKGGASGTNKKAGHRGKRKGSPRQKRR